MEKKKSKFLALLLNAIPGLGQIYYGDNRGIGVGFLTIVGMGFCALMGSQYHAMGELAGLGYLFMILVSEIMTFSFSIDMEKDVEKKRANTALILSFIPGVGHLYLGIMGKGLGILASALLCIFLSGFLGSAIFIFILPILFAYSIFDVKMLLENRNIETSSFGLKPWIGYFLIFSGIFIIIEKLIRPYIPDEILRKAKLLIIALGMIAGGLLIIKPELFKKVLPHETMDLKDDKVETFLELEDAHKEGEDEE